jgi:hypothetical protein
MVWNSKVLELSLRGVLATKQSQENHGIATPCQSAGLAMTE